MVLDKTSGTPENLVSENNSRHKQTNNNQKNPYAFHFVFCNDPSLQLFFSWIGVEERNSYTYLNLNQINFIKNRIILNKQWD